jgi:hypothetical protein
VLEQGVGTEPFEVEQQAGVVTGTAESWRLDLVEPGVVVTPECGSPCVIERLDRAELSLKPTLPCSPGFLAEALGVFVAEFIAYVPETEGRMLRVPFRKRLNHAQRVASESG